METVGGGWTIIQRRLDGTGDFNRYWIEYENGFGNLTGEFWLGLKYISKLSSNCRSTLRVELEDFEEDRVHAEYSYFHVSSSYRYRLSVDGYSGTAGNGLYGGRYSYFVHNGMSFSTRDYDNDKWRYASCAYGMRSGWWFNHCVVANVNGPYGENSRLSRIRWGTSNEDASYYKGTEMKIRCN